MTAAKKGLNFNTRQYALKIKISKIVIYKRTKKGPNANFHEHKKDEIGVHNRAGINLDLSHHLHIKENN